jgi:hypothetical protein
MVTAVGRVYQPGPESPALYREGRPVPEPGLTGHDVWEWVQHHRVKDRVGYMVGSMPAGRAHDEASSSAT